VGHTNLHSTKIKVYNPQQYFLIHPYRPAHPASLNRGTSTFPEHAVCFANPGNPGEENESGERRLGCLEIYIADAHIKLQRFSVSDAQNSCTSSPPPEVSDFCRQCREVDGHMTSWIILNTNITPHKTALEPTVNGRCDYNWDIVTPHATPHTDTVQRDKRPNHSRGPIA
jgi:hypothetical protein